MSTRGGGAARLLVVIVVAGGLTVAAAPFVRDWLEGGSAAHREPARSRSAPPASAAPGTPLSATLRPTWGVDLETGAQRAGVPDLHWRAMTPTARCLCPYPGSGVQVARLPAGAPGDADPAALAGLDYTDEGFAHGDGGDEVRAGLSFAVRTVEGGFAVVRVAGVDANHALTLEWRAPAAVAAGPSPANPSLDVPRLLNDALAARRGKRDAEAAAILERVVAIADSLPPGDRVRIQGLGGAGRLYWSLRDFSSAERHLATAARETVEAGAAASVPWRDAQQTFRMLGVTLRDLGRHRDAVPWFEHAVARGESAPESNHNETSSKYLAITGDLFELGFARCRAGDRSGARDTFARLREACTRLRNPESVHSCTRGDARC